MKYNKQDRLAAHLLIYEFSSWALEANPKRFRLNGGPTNIEGEGDSLHGRGTKASFAPTAKAWSEASSAPTATAWSEASFVPTATAWSEATFAPTAEASSAPPAFCGRVVVENGQTENGQADRRCS